jgi:hypothetical protein
VQRTIEPAIFRGLHPRRARFHEILGVEVRAGGIGRTGRVHDRQVPLLPQRLERRERRMQPEESVQINYRLARNVDAGPHGVVLLLAMGDHNVQPIRRAALEDDDQSFGAGTGCLSRAEGRARKKAGHRRCADHGQRAVAKKNATSNGHKEQLLASSS